MGFSLSKIDQYILGYIDPLLKRLGVYTENPMVSCSVGVGVVALVGIAILHATVPGVPLFSLGFDGLHMASQLDFSSYAVTTLPLGAAILLPAGGVFAAYKLYHHLKHLPEGEREKNIIQGVCVVAATIGIIVLASPLIEQGVEMISSSMLPEIDNSFINSAFSVGGYTTAAFFAVQSENPSLLSPSSLITPTTLLLIPVTMLGLQLLIRGVEKKSKKPNLLLRRLSTLLLAGYGGLCLAQLGDSVVHMTSVPLYAIPSMVEECSEKLLHDPKEITLGDPNRSI